MNIIKHLEELIQVVIEELIFMNFYKLYQI